MDKKPEKQIDPRTELIRQCISLAAAIALVSFILLFFKPTWPTAAGTFALSFMGVAVTYFLSKNRL